MSKFLRSAAMAAGLVLLGMAIGQGTGQAADIAGSGTAIGQEAVLSGSGTVIGGPAGSGTVIGAGDVPFLVRPAGNGTAIGEA